MGLSRKLKPGFEYSNPNPGLTSQTQTQTHLAEILKPKPQTQTHLAKILKPKPQTQTQWPQKLKPKPKYPNPGLSIGKVLTYGRKIKLAENYF